MSHFTHSYASDTVEPVTIVDAMLCDASLLGMEELVMYLNNVSISVTAFLDQKQSCPDAAKLRITTNTRFSNIDQLIQRCGRRYLISAILVTQFRLRPHYCQLQALLQVPDLNRTKA